MDPLLAARARRLRGRIRFQKDLEMEHHRLQLVRERLEKAVAACIDVEVIRAARHINTHGDFIEFIARVQIIDSPLRMASTGFHEVLATALKQLAQKVVNTAAQALDTKAIRLGKAGQG